MTLRWAFVLPGLLAACAEPPPPQQTETPALRAPGAATVPVHDAMQAFREICIDTAPDFDLPRGLMARHGLTRLANTGTVYHASGTMSAKVKAFTARDGSQVKRCSLVFEDPDLPGAEAGLKQLLAAFGPTLSEPRQSVVAIAGAGARVGLVWSIGSGAGAGTGVFMYVPHGGGRSIGGLLLDFPLPTI